MLKRMQTKYADKPVRFLLFPCNQFGSQEPAANADVKKFAEQSVAFAKNAADGNVVMFAKSNLNGVACETTGADTCKPASAECCPRNDAVYDYLLAATPPHTIQWNFDKIIVGKDGKPYAGEAILHGPALDDELSSIIDKLMAEETAGTMELSASTAAVEARALVALSFITGTFALFAAWGMRAARAKEESSEGYYLAA